MGFDKYLLKYVKNDDLNYIVVYNDFTIEKKFVGLIIIISI